MPIFHPNCTANAEDQILPACYVHWWSRSLWVIKEGRLWPLARLALKRTGPRHRFVHLHTYEYVKTNAHYSVRSCNQKCFANLGWVLLLGILWYICGVLSVIDRDHLSILVETMNVFLICPVYIMLCYVWNLVYFYYASGCPWCLYSFPSWKDSGMAQNPHGDFKRSWWSLPLSQSTEVRGGTIPSQHITTKHDWGSQ